VQQHGGSADRRRDHRVSVMVLTRSWVGKQHRVASDLRGRAPAVLSTDDQYYAKDFRQQWSAFSTGPLGCSAASLVRNVSVIPAPQGFPLHYCDEFAPRLWRTQPQVAALHRARQAPTTAEWATRR
jgi:hypothetical protein